MIHLGEGEGWRRNSHPPFYSRENLGATSYQLFLFLNSLLLSRFYFSRALLFYLFLLSPNRNGEINQQGYFNVWQLFLCSCTWRTNFHKGKSKWNWPKTAHRLYLSRTKRHLEGNTVFHIVQQHKRNWNGKRPSLKNFTRPKEFWVVLGNLQRIVKFYIT